MWKDPIIEEVRAARAEVFREAGNDLHKLCELLREAEKQHKDRLVTGTPKGIRKKRPDGKQ